MIIVLALATKLLTSLGQVRSNLHPRRPPEAHPRGAGLPLRHREPALHPQAPLRGHQPGYEQRAPERAPEGNRTGGLLRWQSTEWQKIIWLNDPSATRVGLCLEADEASKAQLQEIE